MSRIENAVINADNEPDEERQRAELQRAMQRINLGLKYGGRGFPAIRTREEDK